MKLYKLSLGLSETNGALLRRREIEVNETGKSYVGEGKRISKDKILLIDTTFFTNGFAVGYFTYCLEYQQKEAVNTLVDKINERFEEITKRYNEVKQMVETMNNNLEKVKAEIKELDKYSI